MRAYPLGGREGVDSLFDPLDDLLGLHGDAGFVEVFQSRGGEEPPAITDAVQDDLAVVRDLEGPGRPHGVVADLIDVDQLGPIEHILEFCRQLRPATHPDRSRQAREVEAGCRRKEIGTVLCIEGFEEGGHRCAGAGKGWGD